eukprot:Rhum_TRINITY_DN14550_c8_g1::Rhum_TRINITY_DN14550_c8_g1_i1::g.97164::m.97164
MRRFLCIHRASSRRCGCSGGGAAAAAADAVAGAVSSSPPRQLSSARRRRSDQASSPSSSSSAATAPASVRAASVAAAAAAAARMVTVAQKAGLPLSAGQASHFLRELARPGVAAWDASWDGPLAFLCAEVRRSGGGTAAEAAAALKAVTVCHARLSVADKEATLDALEAQLAGAGGGGCPTQKKQQGRAAPAHRALPAPAALSVLVSTARAHRANYPLCRRVAASVLHSVGGDLSRLTHDAFASLLYALPRHGVTALSDPDLVARCDAAAVAAFGCDGDRLPEAATASSLTRVLGGAAALPLPALAAVARACARACV